MKQNGVKTAKKEIKAGIYSFCADICKSDGIYLALLFITNFIWFSFIKFKTLMGDDILLMDYFDKYKSIFTAFSGLCENKYRPVFMAVDYILYMFAGYNYRLYFFVNIVINMLIIYVVYKIFDYLLKNKYFALIFSLVFLTARFSYYNIMQQLGVMESTALLLFASILYCTIKYLNENKKNQIIFASMLSFIVPFVHERFLVVPVLLSLIILVANRSLKIRMIAVNLFSIVLNVFIKIFVMKTQFFLGTAGKDIDFSNVQRIVKFVFKGLTNMLGINAGPRYLAGIYFEKSEPLVIVFSLLIFFACLITVIVYFAGAAKKKEISLFSILTVSVIAFFGMILTASICIRQEFRWLYAPYLFWLILLSLCAKKILATDKLKYICLTVFAVISVYNNIYHRNHLGDFYITRAQKCADSLYEVTIDKYGKTIMDNHDLYIQNFRDHNWITMGDLFFELYTGKDLKNKIYYFDNPADLKIPDGSPARIYLFNDDTLSFKEVTLAEVNKGK